MNRYEITHKQDGRWMAVKLANSAEEAILSLISERGYGYYTPEVLTAKELPPIHDDNTKLATEVYMGEQRGWVRYASLCPLEQEILNLLDLDPADIRDGTCPARGHLPEDNTKLVTTADCGWCGRPVVVRG